MNDLAQVATTVPGAIVLVVLIIVIGWIIVSYIKHF
jgi:hypothetical protein